MKQITVVIPTYNEEANVPLIIERIRQIFNNSLSTYDYRILFIDNCSTDKTQITIKEHAETDEKIQYIFNTKNFGFSRSTYYGLTQSKGDCSILLFADMQDPPEVIIDFVNEWEKGNTIVIGIKNKSKENPVKYWMRTKYYKFINQITDINHIEHFTGFGLYDQSIISVLASVEDPLPYLRGIVAELAPEPKRVFYEQEKRAYGKSNFNFFKLYDLAMLGITSYSKVLLRLSSFVGLSIAIISFLVALITVILKLSGVVDYPIASAATTFGVFFIGSVQLIFIGILGEYLANINIRTMGRPLVVERERKNI